jgi:hypothetical protein
MVFSQALEALYTSSFPPKLKLPPAAHSRGRLCHTGFVLFGVFFAQ